jgi:dTDP-3-amino-3,4,6-trideoxy-alpha-D-glucose transaminase
VGVANGTDALELILRGLGIGPGDEVIVPTNTFVATAAAVCHAGARPVFVDVLADTLLIDPEAVSAAVTPATAAVMAVHLFGQMVDADALRAVADRHGLGVIEDAAQAHGARYRGRPVGTFGIAGAFSFYPTKNLGALGDGGAVVTNDTALAERIRRLRNGGQTDRYTHVEPGVNSRLDEIQAAVLRARLAWLGRWTDERRRLARRYREALGTDTVRVPAECDRGHVYHLFPVRTPDRSALMAHLEACGIGSIVHYPVPLPRQAAFAPDAERGRAVAPLAETPNADRLCREVCSLPLHPGLTDGQIDAVVAAVRSWQPSRRAATTSR